MNPKLKDNLRFLRKQTLARMLNNIKVLSSYYLSKWTQKPIMWGEPIAVSIEPTTSCNLRCPECPSGLRAFTRNTGMLKLDTLKTIINRLSKRTSYLTLYFQGEPFLNTMFFDFVRYATEKGLYVATSTNAHYLNDENARKTIESGLDRLVISIDGTTQDTYKQYRVGGNLDKVLQGTKNIVAWKKKLNSPTPFIIFQFLVVKHNEHQVEEVKNMAKELSVDAVFFKTAQVYDYENGNNLIPDNQEYSRYKRLSNGKYALKNKMLNQCWRLWHGCVFTWDGYVVPCCFDKDASYKMGNILEENFESIWHNESYKSFRGKLLKSRTEIDICSNCTEGTKVSVEFD